MKALLTIIILMASLAASETSLALMLRSYHSNASHKADYAYNNATTGLMLSHTGDSGWGGQVGFYKNSFYKFTKYVGGHFEKNVSEDLKVGVAVSVMDGYEDISENGLVAIPVVSVQYKQWLVTTTAPFTEYIGQDTVTSLFYVVPLN